jgi:glycosyltransferase involved in cell wall biosynthesis
VMPRRYGGLSLPMQEAASLGMGVITTDLEPQNRWFPPDSLVPASLYAQFRTPVGRIDIHACDPRDLAAKMDEFSRDPGLMAWCSRASEVYAQSISWETLKPQYEELFA